MATVQIRELDDEVAAVLRSRAAAEGLSLTQYLRRELTQLAALPTMTEWHDRIQRDRERGYGVSGAVLAAAFDDLRRDREER